jgi:hypothetical protein
MALRSLDLTGLEDRKKVLKLLLAARNDPADRLFEEILSGLRDRCGKFGREKTATGFPGMKFFESSEAGNLFL